MTWSFDIRNGDLSLGGPGGIATVTGKQKLLQDLRCRLLEPIGTDPVNPTYGSNLDGGIDSIGNQVVSHIGGLLSAAAIMEIEAEVIRCLQTHQKQQIDRIKREQDLYAGNTYFASSEILYQINSVEPTQIGSTLLVKVSIRTADGQSLQIVQPVGVL